MSGYLLSFFVASLGLELWDYQVISGGVCDKLNCDSVGEFNDCVRKITGAFTAAASYSVDNESGICARKHKSNPSKVARPWLVETRYDKLLYYYNMTINVVQSAAPGAHRIPENIPNQLTPIERCRATIKLETFDASEAEDAVSQITTAFCSGDEAKKPDPKYVASPREIPLQLINGTQFIFFGPEPGSAYLSMVGDASACEGYSWGDVTALLTAHYQPDSITPTVVTASLAASFAFFAV